MMKATNGGRRVLDDSPVAKVRGFISSKPDAQQQVFRCTLGEFIDAECGHKMSNRAVGGMLHRIGCRRRPGKIKVPSPTPERLARIRRFLVEFDAAVREEERGDAVIVYIENFVHQLHGSTYSYFFTDESNVIKISIWSGAVLALSLRVKKLPSFALFCSHFKSCIA